MGIARIGIMSRRNQARKANGSRSGEERMGTRMHEVSDSVITS
ncbi:hypothetical protein HanXRQr2_Chr10g0441951 [Helianthus annuus]|uniref:Uncharacterized protein n=1 Tax=Helianthus annuus TaxID=4232 RepID=A0A9K3HYD8_HELAN|nr:hypothetical protein HanXRQr2_Chr10g0441951 [Helianthus annuus]